VLAMKKFKVVGNSKVENIQDALLAEAHALQTWPSPDTTTGCIRIIISLDCMDVIKYM
jgi:hypothetical protein